jgi:uncharacterized protein YcfL
MRTKLAAIFGLALAVAGCHSPSVNTVQNAQPTGQRSMISDSRVVSDTTLDRRVGVVGLNTAMTAGGFLKVQVELLNRTRSPQNFNYQFQWFDVNGMQIGVSQTAMVGDEIDGAESKFISAIAPTEAAKDFRLKLLLGQ